MSIRQTTRQTLRASTIRETLLGEGGVNTDFVMVFATTGASETLTIPCQNVGTFDATINWGDGEADSTITAYNDADLAHVYADAGDYTVTISGTFPNIYFNNGGDKLKLKEITNWGDTGLSQLAAAFHGCVNLTSVSHSYANLSLVVNANNAFRSCSAMASFKTSGLENMQLVDAYGFFGNCTLLADIDLSLLDMSATTTIAIMLYYCTSLTDAAIDGWGIGLVTDATNFSTGWALPTARYDATLVAWQAQPHQSTVTANFGNSTYTLGSAAATARAALVTTDLWVIIDNGGV